MERALVGVTNDDRQERLAWEMLAVLPSFGRWASTVRDYETPYGKAGFRQLEILYILRNGLLETDHPLPSDLASFLGVRRSVITRMLAKLEASGFITHAPHPVDGRAHLIDITEKGAKISDYVAQELLREIDKTIADLGEDELLLLEKAMPLLSSIAKSLKVSSETR